MISVREATPREDGPSRFPWIEERTGCVLTRNARAIEAVREDGEIVGMVAYDNWTPASVQAHMAVDSAIVWRRLLRAAFDYPFRFAGKSLLIGIIAANNERSVAAVESFGFIETHRFIDGWREGVDLIVYEMRRKDCRWLKG